MTDLPNRRICAFCGGTPLTEEHVWPRWVATILSGEALQYERRALGEAPTMWQRMGLEVTVRRVCAACNNGWLSELEAVAKPILEPLILGQATMLGPREADIAALWCVKTIFMFQFTHSDRREVPDDQYPWLCEHRAPPPNTFAWLAGYDGARWAAWYHHQILGLRAPGQPDTGDRGYCATAAVGALVFQVTGIAAIDPVEVIKASEKEPYIAQVWPSRGEPVHLPPSLLLNDRSLREFADPFGAENAEEMIP